MHFLTIQPYISYSVILLLGSGMYASSLPEGVSHDRPDEADYKWAQDSYSSTQRTIDTWTFFTVFRTQLFLLDQKWSYIGGFSEDSKKERTRSLAKYMLESVLNLGESLRVWLHIQGQVCIHTKCEVDLISK